MLSRDGQYVAFASLDRSLVGPDDRNRAADIYLWSHS
jgi:hypothetical protein